MYPDSKVHWANVGPTLGRQDPGEPQVGHMKFAIWVLLADLSEFLNILFAGFQAAAMKPR